MTEGREIVGRRSHARLTTLLVLSALVCASCSAKLSDHGARLNGGDLEYAIALCEYEQLVELRVDGPNGQLEPQIADAGKGPGLAVVVLLGAVELPNDTSEQFRVFATIGRGEVEWERELTFRLDEIPESDDSWFSPTREIKKNDQMQANSCWTPEG